MLKKLHWFISVIFVEMGLPFYWHLAFVRQNLSTVQHMIGLINFITRQVNLWKINTCWYLHHIANSRTSTFIPTFTFSLVVKVAIYYQFSCEVLLDGCCNRKIYPPFHPLSQGCWEQPFHVVKAQRPMRASQLAWTVSLWRTQTSSHSLTQLHTPRNWCKESWMTSPGTSRS